MGLWYSSNTRPWHGRVRVRLPVGPQMPAKKFQRKIESFICEMCSAEIKGNGYTDHCPNCLWGKHVDVNPGDRSANCGGMMEPIGVETSHGKHIIMYRCEKCGYEFKVKIAMDDNIEIITGLINKSL